MSRRAALVWIPLLPLFGLVGLVGCGAFLSLGDDDDPPPPPTTPSTTTPPSGVTDGALNDGDIQDGHFGQEPSDGGDEASLIDADADAGPGCIRRFERCLETAQCCGRLQGGQFKEVCRNSPRVCERCAQTGEACTLRSECCGVTSVCTGGFCEN